MISKKSAETTPQQSWSHRWETRWSQKSCRLPSQWASNIAGDTYWAYRPKWQQPVFRPSPVTAVGILPLLQDVLLAFEVCLQIAQPAARTKLTSISQMWAGSYDLSFVCSAHNSGGLTSTFILFEFQKTSYQAAASVDSNRYLQTTKYLYRPHCRHRPLALVWLLLLQVVHIAVDLRALSIKVGLLEH